MGSPAWRQPPPSRLPAWQAALRPLPRQACRSAQLWACCQPPLALPPARTCQLLGLSAGNTSLGHFSRATEEACIAEGAGPCSGSTGPVLKPTQLSRQVDTHVVAGSLRLWRLDMRRKPGPHLHAGGRAGFGCGGRLRALLQLVGHGPAGHLGGGVVVVLPAVGRRELLPV